MSDTELSGGGMVTSGHRDIDTTTGQQKGYVVLSAEERKKGFVRPLRHNYIHDKCGVETKMASDISETYARQPDFYAGTFCVGCRAHFPVDEFVWSGTDQKLGS